MRSAFTPSWLEGYTSIETAPLVFSLTSSAHLSQPSSIGSPSTCSWHSLITYWAFWVFEEPELLLDVLLEEPLPEVPEEQAASERANVRERAADKNFFIFILLFVYL